MRLLTDEQHAQIVEAFNKVIATGLDQRTHNEFTFVSGHYLHEALAVLQALPEVEVVAHVGRENLEYLKTCHGDESTQLRYANGFPKWVPSYVQENYLPLYATKEPS